MGISKQYWTTGVLISVVENMITFGTHPICKECEKRCKTYNAPNTYFICFDFNKKSVDSKGASELES